MLDKLIGDALDITVDRLVSRSKETRKKEITRIFGLLEKLNRKDPVASGQIHAIKKSWVEQNSFGLLLNRFMEEVQPNVQKKFIKNFALNSGYGTKSKIRKNFYQKEGFFPPFTVLISPTMRCNLNCVGCYAANYIMEDDLEVEVIDRVIREAKSIGIYFFTILGGEPFIYEPLWEIFDKHSDAAFQVYSNGTMLNERKVERLVGLGNVALMISVEGFEENTKARRGDQVYQKVMYGFDLLKEAGALYGFSTTVNRHNVEEICSDRFNELMINKGCVIGWHFLYMPIGHNPDINLMPTPKQREYMRVNGAARIRNKYPLFAIDFWNDAPYVGGCIAAGRDYLHINSNGDVEPCIFTHFAVDNIKEKSLSEALTSPYFKAIRDRQPFDKNLLLPCQLIDHPDIFREIFNKYHPYPTHSGAESLVSELSDQLDTYSLRVKSVMDKAWEVDFKERGFKYTGKK